MPSAASVEGLGRSRRGVAGSAEIPIRTRRRRQPGGEQGTRRFGESGRAAFGRMGGDDLAPEIALRRLTGATSAPRPRRMLHGIARAAVAVMSRIRILPDDVEIEALPGETVLAAALRAGVPHLHLCGGNAHCSTCRIELREGADQCAPQTAAEQRIAQRLHFQPGLRLACQTVVQGPMTVRRLVLDAHDARLVDQRGRAAAEASVGEERRLAILFADIRGFTAFSERLPPYDVIHVLNRYFHAAGEVIARYGGRIDNYMGDGFMALFSQGDEDAPACLRAVSAGLALIDAVAALQPYLLTAFGEGFGIGVGIHYGCAVVGSVGAAGNERVTAIGDAVNLASRIEEANKRFGTQLLISAQTWAQVAEQVQIGAIHETALAGKSGSYRLFEVRGLRAG